MVPRVLALCALWVAASACTVLPTRSSPDLSVAEPRQVVNGLVLALSGAPVADARVSSDGVVTTTGPDGRFQLLATAPGLVQVSAEHFLPRTEVVSPRRPVLSRLTPQDGHTVSIRFGGDVMAGRRFYDPNEDGHPDDALLREGDGVEAHTALLRDVQPYLQQADLTIVNLESPLGANPAFDPKKARPERFHRTKDYAFSSAREFADGLARAGVDIVDVGNNHLFDRLDVGIADTLRALDRAGVKHFGAGVNATEAWKPVRVTVRGERLSFVGCTTITGEDDPTPYVATDIRSGAASCDQARLVAVINGERALGATVFASVHGGFEYERQPSMNVRALSLAARGAGANVVNHHPHVIGGLEYDGRTAFAPTLGNLLFDQEVEATFPSYLLSVDVNRGRLVRVRTEPLLLEGYLPTPVLGRLADVSDRFAAGLIPGAGTYGPDGTELVPGGATLARSTTATLEPDRLQLLTPGWSISAVSGPRLQLGQELLWSGSFEDETTSASGGGHLWDLTGSAVALSPEGAHSGLLGVQLRAAASGELSAVLSTRHRLGLPERLGPVTAVGWARSEGPAALTVELHWYPDTKGPSTSITRLELQPTQAWGRFGIDATPPADAVAVQVYLRLPASAEGAVAFVDDLALVQWAGPGTPATPLYGAVRALGAAQRSSFWARVPAGSLSLPDYLPASPLWATP